MNGPRWIDEFFRKRMERRTFPVENGEFDEVLALIQKRNGTAALIRGGRFSKWWLSALIPLAGVLWWAVGDEAGETRMLGSRTAEHQPDNGRSGIESDAHWATSANADVKADQPPTAENKTSSGEGATTSSNERALPILDVRTQTKENVPLRRAAQELLSVADVAMDAPDQRAADLQTHDLEKAPRNHGEGVQQGRGNVVFRAADTEGTQQTLRTGARLEHGRMNAQTDGPDEPQRSINEGSQPDKENQIVRGDDLAGSQRRSEIEARIENGRLNAQADDLDEALPSLPVGAPSEQGSTDTTMDDQGGTPVGLRTGILSNAERSIFQGDGYEDLLFSEALDVLPSPRDVDAVAFLQPRWSAPRMADPAQPAPRDMPVIKWLSMGELHVFGAPLFVRTRTRGGGRSGVETGSLFGFEYRVRVKRFAWATGVHYGTYALKADQGATDVELSYVEVPLLASMKVSKGRFGLLMQGGMSVDLLFNSRGRYPADEDRTSAGFPDDAFRTVNYSWLLRPQATFHVDEQLSMSAGPLWKAQLGEVAKAGPLDGAHVSSSGVSFGISYRLERSTF